jgi:hypothetical protein
MKRVFPLIIRSNLPVADFLIAIAGGYRCLPGRPGDLSSTIFSLHTNSLSFKSAN